MKKLTKIGAFLLAVLMVSSCEDPELGPVVTFETATIGAYIRQVEIRTAEYDLANINTSAIDYSVDFVDVQNGDLVTEFVVDIQFIDNNPSNGNKSGARKVFKTYAKSDFSTSSRGNPGTDVVLPLTDAMTAFGLVEADLLAGDAFAFFGTITLDDGSSYSSTTSTSTIRGSAFQGLFDVTANVTCPIDDALFTGSYTMTLTSGTSSFWGDAARPVLGAVTLSTVAGSTTKRNISQVGVLPNFGPFNRDMVIDFVCDKVQALPNSAGGCSGSGIVLTGKFDGVEYSDPIDIANDMTINLTWVEDGSGCGYADLYTATLTKN